MAGKSRTASSFNKAQGGRQVTIKTFPMPEDTIADNFISAGWILAQMDLAGGRRAYQYIGNRAVTIGVQAMAFKKPIHVGDEVSIYTKVKKEGNTSLQLKVEAWALPLGAQKAEKVTEGVFTFVAIDNKRRPVPIKTARSLPAPRPGELSPGLRAGVKQDFNEPACARDKVLALRTVPEPRDTNYNGDIFGGWILAQMDKACAKEARKFSGYQVATVGLEAMTFHNPVYVGDEISFYTEIAKKGRTSVTIKVESWALRREGHYEKVTEGLLSYVAVDKNRKPVVIKAEPKKP